MDRPKILLIRFSSIGDLVLTTPVIRTIKTQLNAEVHFLLKPAFVGVLSQNPYIDRIIALEGNVHDSVEKLKGEKYTHVVDLQKNLKSIYLSGLLPGKKITFHKLNFRKWLTVRIKRNVLPENKHLVDRYFDALRPLNVLDDGEGLDFFILPEDDMDGYELVRGLSFQVLVLGAAHATKRIPFEKCLEIISQNPGHTVLLGGEDVAGISARLNQELPEKTLDLCGKIGLGVSAAILRYAHRVISGDTGMMHIAAALKKEIIVIWGNTIPSFGMYPFYGKNYPDYATHLEVAGLSCRPCSKLGFENCPKGHFRCMMDQEISGTVFGH